MCRVKTTASAWGDCKLPTPICNILQPVGYAILRTISYTLDIRLSSVLRVWSKFCTISLPFFAVPCSSKVLLRLQRLIQALFLQLDMHLLLFLSLKQLLGHDTATAAVLNRRTFRFTASCVPWLRMSRLEKTHNTT